jgi:hypothetical protein
LEYLTVNSKLRVSVRGFTKQADADSATFSLLRSDNQKRVLDQTATQVKKTAARNPLTWEIAIDEDLIKAAITDDEMQCDVSVSITAGGKTWSPPGQKYVIYRNKITLAATDKDNVNLAGARCTCTIRTPHDYHPKSAHALAWKREPNTVITRADGTAELTLDAPGELDLEWGYPYYPQDNAAWTAKTGVKRDTVLLARERKAHFVWPETAKGEEQKHFVNLRPQPLSNRGRKLRIEVGSKGGLAGDKIYLTVELTSQDTKDADDGVLKCVVEGELEVGKPKKTLTLTLDDDGGSKAVELDFKGYGGITARLAVSTVEGSSDEKVDVTSWRKAEVQPYHPATGLFQGHVFPEVLAQKVKASFAEVFIDIEFLHSKLLGSAFPGVEEAGKFEVVEISDAHAQDAGLDAGRRGGQAALVYFKMGRFVAPTPADWIAGPGSSGSGERYASIYRTYPQTALHAVFAHACYETRAVPVSLTLSGEKAVSEPQTTTTALAARNIDEKENSGSLILPWSSTDPSYWQVVGEDTRGKVTMAFIEIDREKAKQGEYEYKVRLPDHAAGDPKGLAAGGKDIRVNVNLRGYEFGVAGANLPPVLYIGLDPDYASARCAYTVVHELAHALGFAPHKGEFFYSLAGNHCASGIKSDAEAFVQENKGTIGSTVNETLTRGLTGRNVPLELAAAGKFGQCVMWGHTHRQKTTVAMFSAALQFCSACAPLVRVTPMGSIIGGET